jgi:hypothetical protein
MDHATCPALEMERTPYRLRTAPLGSRRIEALDDAPRLSPLADNLAHVLRQARPDVLAFGGERDAWRGALDAWRDSVDAVLEALDMETVRTSADLFRYRCNW